MSKIYIAMINNHKVSEISQILKDCPYEISAFGNMPDIEETGTTFKVNASIKAIELSKLTDNLVMADDSGLCVDVLHGEPEIFSAPYVYGKSMAQLLPAVKIPLPLKVLQQDIVNIYSAYNTSNEINERLKIQIKDICPILIKGSINEAKRNRNV